MRELAIGDIHGCARSFEALLGIIQPQPDDTIVLLGDYVDRGSDSYRVIELILELQRKCTVIPLSGNHEHMILSARRDPEALAEWMRFGGLATLDSYTRRGLGKGIEAVPEAHWDFLENQTLDYYETDERIYVHATVHPQLEMQEQSDLALFWEPFTDPTMHKSGKEIVCGHKSQKSGRPALFRKGVCIDTWVYGDGWLTCMDAGQKIFMQTNERGQRRMLDLRALGTR